MRQPRWKQWLSHFTEIVLERGETDLHDDLQLGLKKGRYCLSTPNAIYSYGDLYDNFSKTFQLLQVDKLPFRDVLVLGFGLGSIPLMLEKKFGKKCRYTGVEADELIAHWAASYVLDELESPVQMNLTDALFFVETCRDKFDLIAMDIFIDNVVPVEMEELSYLKNLKRLLKKDGILLFNRMTFTETDKQESLDFFENRFKTIFPNGRYFDLKGNWMLLNK